MKKTSPETAIILKEGIKTDLNGWESKIKKELSLELSNEQINMGFFIENCINNKYLIENDSQLIEIEKAIIEVLIETQGLSEKVEYNQKINFRIVYHIYILLINI